MQISTAWGELSPELNHRILECAYLNDKTLYRKLNRELSQGLRKRPKQLLEMPRRQRHELFQPLLSIPVYLVLAQNTAINWLTHDGNELMVTFLDALEIAHDGRGCSERFPDDVDEKKLTAAMEKLMQGENPEAAAFYLSIFPDISGTRWERYASVLDKVAGSSKTQS